MKEFVELVTKFEVWGLKNLTLDFEKIPEGPKMVRKSLNYFSGFRPRDASYGS